MDRKRNSMKIFLDIDDVCADWKGAARQIVDRSWEYDEHVPETQWDKVKAKIRFYRDLPVRAGAEELVQRCKEAVRCGQATELFFLTALPRNNDVPYAVYDKVNWCNKHFPDIPMFIGPYSHDKWHHCSPGDILIDDRVSNCREWTAAGGHAHIYRSWEECKPWLENLLSKK